MSSFDANRHRQGHASVNGLKMHYWVEGNGPPLVYIPPALGHAGMKSFPELARSHAVISIDLQGHGRTADIAARALSLEQHAADIVELLRCLRISKADFLGESFGGAVATIIALEHPALVRRVATYGATFGPAALAHNLDMLRFDQPPTADSRGFRYQRASYREVAPHPEHWSTLWNKVASIRWEGFSDEQLGSIEAPVLIAVGDQDFVRIEHAVASFRRIPNAELAVIPDASHFLLFSEPERLVPVVKHFLEKPEHRPPLATAQMGYQPGETR
ncbi:MAG TPA: alpha/beta hydrolase [Polyangiaceae bacterium]|nr:alpha/beta hydrolase [Polyangiaceae bacterium]